MAEEPQARRRELLGHPVGLFVCFATEMWERFAFYGMKALLFLYLTRHHRFSDADGYLLLGTYAGLAYALPVVGGMLADRFLGMRKAVQFGGVLLVLGQFGMAFTGEPAAAVDGELRRDDAALQIFHLSLALIIVGVGFLKPNISTVVGRLYADDDPRRDSAFTIFYMGINVGAFVSSLVCGWLGVELGWHWGFGAAGVGMLVGLAVFGLGRAHLRGLAEPPDPARLRERVWGGVSRETAIYLGGIGGIALVQQVLQWRLTFLSEHEITATEAVAVIMTAVLFVWWVRFVLRECTGRERGRMVVLMVLMAVSTVFWGLYEQTYGTWLAFSDRAMDRTALGVDWSASQLTSIGALFIFVLAPPFAWLWPRLDARGLNPGPGVKFSIGLACAGLAHFVLVWAIARPDAAGLIGLWALVLAYFLLEVGEMALSPIGLSAVTTLSVPRVVSLMMGVWFLFSAFGEMLAGRLGTLAAIEDPRAPVADLLAVYTDVFSTLGWIGVGSGLALLLIARPLDRVAAGITARGT